MQVIMSFLLFSIRNYPVFFGERPNSEKRIVPYHLLYCDDKPCPDNSRTLPLLHRAVLVPRTPLLHRAVLVPRTPLLHRTPFVPRFGVLLFAGVYNGILDCVWVSTSGKLRVVRNGMSDSDNASIFFGMARFIID